MVSVLIVEDKFQGAGKNHSVLLAAMRVARDDGAAQQHQSREGGVGAVQHLAGDQRVHLIGVEQFEFRGGRHQNPRGEIGA